MSSPTQHPALEISGLSFSYDSRFQMNIDTLTLPPGQSLGVIGSSGCGKTTLLHLVAGLLTPSAGSIAVCGQALHELSIEAADRFRGQHIGIVFQKLHLLSSLTVFRNLELAQHLSRRTDDRNRILQILERLNIADLVDQRPGSLSVGQAQRVAIARALVQQPKLLLADEPTSALDDEHANAALDLLIEESKAIGAALVVVTHDRRVCGRLDLELNLGGKP